MPHALGIVLLLGGVVWLVSTLAERLGALSPVLLVVAGFALSWVPGLPHVALDPHVALSLLLPPLLFAAALTASVPAFRANVRPIGLLAVALVLFTTVVVGLVAHAVVPRLSLAAALTLGAIVAPPDAVAATAVARRTGLPRRVVAILEGESLLNDASALIAYRVAVSAALAGSFSLLGAAGQFAWATAGGLLAGAAVVLLDRVLHTWVADEPVLDNALSVLTPFVAYGAGEAVHASGVLAVVVAGLVIGHRLPLQRSASARLQLRAVWLLVEFLLQGAVFLLIGLQLRQVLQGLHGIPISELVVGAVAVVAAVVLSRPLWVFPASYLARLLPFVDTPPRGSWGGLAVVSWAGMRGVVSLAAALALAADFPERSLVLFLTLVVIVVTLVVQGLTLPWVIRWLGVAGPDPVTDLLTEASAREQAAEAGLRRLDELAAAEPAPDGVVARLRALSQTRSNSAWERLGAATSPETPSSAYRRLRLGMLEAERGTVVGLRDEGRIPEEIMAGVLRDLDLEEALLRQVAARTGDGQVERADQVGAPGPGEKVETAVDPMKPRPGCEHTARLPERVQPSSQDGCSDCLAAGRHDWVHLRLCLSCGHVGCCDSSPRRHATAHVAATDHPVIRSFEPGEDWRWCYVDDALV